ncbi:hypothetical protein MRX96_005304 [Rhipicephalus microplus]
MKKAVLVVSSNVASAKVKNSVVQCGRETCPLPRGCYFLQESKGNKCCDVCKGCFYKGRLYASSEEWTDPHDPCRRFFCQSGVITESRIYCHAASVLTSSTCNSRRLLTYPQRAEVTPGPAVSPRSSQQPRYLDLDTPLLSLELTAAAIPELTDARGAVVVAMARRPTPPRRHFSIHHGPSCARGWIPGDRRRGYRAEFIGRSRRFHQSLLSKVVRHVSANLGALQGVAQGHGSGRGLSSAPNQVGGEVTCLSARASLDALARELQFPFGGTTAAWACLPTLTGKLAAAGALFHSARCLYVKVHVLVAERGRDLEPCQEPSRALVANKRSARPP